MKFLGNLIDSCQHPHAELATQQLKIIKSSLMCQHTANDLWQKGKDAEERLKKDSKLKVLFACCAHLKSYAESKAKICQWKEDHSDICTAANEAVKGSNEGDCALLNPDMVLIDLDVVGKLDERAMNEKDESVMDCVERHLAGFQTSLATRAQCLKKATQNFYLGGTQDWKRSFGQDIQIEGVLKAAGDSILKVKGVSIKEQIEFAEKERSDCVMLCSYVFVCFLFCFLLFVRCPVFFYYILTYL